MISLRSEVVVRSVALASDMIVLDQVMFSCIGVDPVRRVCTSEKPFGLTMSSEEEEVALIISSQVIVCSFKTEKETIGTMKIKVEELTKRLEVVNVKYETLKDAKHET